jgi:Ca-activated chloride channel family protein
MRLTDLTIAAAALLAATFVLTGAKPNLAATERPVPPQLRTDEVGEGSLIRVDPYSKHTGELCPLKRTDVRGEITGFLARVTVTQEFENNSSDKIEAVYTFPLPRLAAVDDMTMLVGDRTVRAEIKRRAEARQIYEQARNNGHVTALLEQNRPNVFQQSVANIEPGAKVKVTISYVETLKYEEGSYEFSFPMTVGPRYKDGGLNPKYAPQGTRAGHDLSLSLKLDAGVAIDSLTSKTHEISVDRPSTHQANLRLKQNAVIPNKDFILRYDVAGAKMQDALLTHRAQRGGFFTLILQPPDRVTAEDVTPKELVFVLDTSGSMSGFPIEKAKETMKLALAGLYPRDTFNLITFAGDTYVLFPKPVPATAANLQQAQQFLAGTRGGGGTEMMKAIRAALEPSGDPEKVRIVCFMTDGYVGNENEIIAEIKKNSNARVFSFGIGSSVNRFLLDKMAEEGRGEVEYVALNDDGSAAARRFHERVRNPLLTDVSIDWHGLPVSDIYPKRSPDLFSAKPVVIHGRYTAPAAGMLTLRGRMAGRPFTRNIQVNLPADQKEHDVLATLWARSRVEELMSRDPLHPDETEVTRLGLDYRLMTQYTSFVAVEDRMVTRDGRPVRIEVPVEMPEGVSHEGVFGAMASQDRAMNAPIRRIYAQKAGSPAAMPPSPPAMREMPSYLPREKRAQSGGNAESVSVQAASDALKAQKLDSGLESLLAGRHDGAALVEVEIWLTDATPSILDSLRKLGFTATAQPKIAKIRTGKVRLDQVRAIAALSEVVTIRLVPSDRR